LLLLLTATAVLSRAVKSVGFFPEEAYRLPSYLKAALTDRNFLLTMLPLFLVGVDWRRLRWGRDGLEPRDRIVAMAAALPLVWSYVTYPANPWTGQFYALERLLLLAAFAGLWFHPVAVVPLIMVLIPAIGQVLHPLPESGWALVDRTLPVDLLFVLLAYLVLSVLSRHRLPRQALLRTSLVVTAMHYAYAGLDKVRAGPTIATWILENDLSHLLVAAHLNGDWLRQLTQQSIEDLTRVMSVVEVPFALVAVVIEMSAVLLLLGPRAARLTLLALIALHLGILSLSGIFFWKWILVDTGLLLALRATSTDTSARKPWMVSALAVLALAPWIMDRTTFAWWNTRATNFFVIETVDASGQAHRIDPRDFAPYDILVQQSRFFDLRVGPTRVDTFSTLYHLEEARLINRASLESYLKLPPSGYQGYPRSSRAQRMREFLATATTNLAHRDSGRLGSLAPPSHFCCRSSTSAQAYSGARLLRVSFVEYFWDGDAIHEVQREVVLEAPLSDPVDDTQD
jgi:hypothetical protein